MHYYYLACPISDEVEGYPVFRDIFDGAVFLKENAGHKIMGTPGRVYF